MKQNSLVIIGAVFTALLSTLCCLPALLFLFFGVSSGVLSFFTTLEYIDYSNKISNVSNFYSLIFFLKFFHIIFIIYYYKFVINNFQFYGCISYNLISSNLLNFIFLFFFNILSMLYFYKNIINFFLKFYYY